MERRTIIEQRIMAKREAIETLEEQLRSEREDLYFLQQDLVSSLREELSETLAEKVRATA